MQTAIHFEGDLAYICVSDQGEIKEEEVAEIEQKKWAEVPIKFFILVSLLFLSSSCIIF